MTAHPVDVAWLDGRETVTRAELARASGLSEADITELVEYGALQVLSAGAAEPVFSAECLSPLRRASRVRRDFDLDLFAVAVLLQYLNRIDELERQVRTLRAHLPFHAPTVPREGPQPWREPHG
ncbi:chaperone modulator CbpM [Ramlibacter sp.]|uniref:chaperone modulator CbpM n=1 Tax=Ramlibacter sp. TaxID=1917967 RepID=UPI002C0673FE|nr:chaperone modulator CbpM [Ramlibacter sp.]HWI81153.1 chaperone modulator CbpM [Ramlibacter sp.]